MLIGIPKEIKPLEGRVALTPAAIGELIDAGHELFVQADAGTASGYADELYQSAGATILPDAATLYTRARLIVKVKEPIAPEFPLLRREHMLFSFLHLAANPELARALQAKRLTALAFETVEHDGKLPLLAPMSEIAGKLAVQIGATLLHAPHGGRGILLGGLAATERGRVVVLGAGEAGGAAAALAAALGAEVTVFARGRDSLARMHALGPNVTALGSTRAAIAQALAGADLLIGAVLIPGARAPRLVSAGMVQDMQDGAVIVDISVDQGGCVETTRPTDYSNPTYVVHGVTHFAVTNMPGGVPRTATQALSAALLPYVQRLARADGLHDPLLRGGVNVQDGKLAHPAVAEALGGA
ncbi:MAG: alanine dehydrogenase [Gammaproteobacteria bacterium]|nr:alanine dehydrogenase [Gammaproteobacteria bacterium]